MLLELGTKISKQVRELISPAKTTTPRMSTEVKQEKKQRISFKKSLQDAIKKQKDAEKEIEEAEAEEDADVEEEAKGKPKKPKKEKKPRSLTGYNIFTREKWAEVKANKGEDQKLVATELSKEFGQQWKELSDEERQKYSELADKYNAEHGLPATKRKKERDGHPREPNAYQA